MVRRLILLVIVVLVGHAVWKVGPAYVAYFEFRHRLEEIARFSADRSEGDIRHLAVEAAERHGLPVTEDLVEVQKGRDHTRVSVRYRQPLEVLPRYFYPWEVAIDLDVLVARRGPADVR